VLPKRLRIEIDGYQLGILDFSYIDAWYPKTDGRGAALEIIDPLGLRASWEEKTSWRATAANPGFNGIFAVLAGEDVSLCLPDDAALEGVVTLGPEDPGSVTLQWSKVSGPGTVTFSSPNAEATTARFSGPGIYGLRLSAAGTTTALDDLTVSVGDSYDGWAFRTLNSSNPLITGMLQDPDKDGMQNLLEFAFGSDPASSSATGRPIPAVNGVELSMTYQRYTGCDLSYIVEASGDLVSWSSATVTESMIASFGTLQTWKAVDTTPVSDGSRRYLRVRVTSR